MRLFAAIPVTEDVALRLAQLQEGLGGWRRVDPALFHVTLAFFGEVDGAAARDLDAALGAVDGPALSLWVDGVGVFGGDRPRVAYAAIRPDPALTTLRDKVRRAARMAGVEAPAERFTPHVTLARGGGRADQRLGRWLARASAFLAGPMPAPAFHLYRSELGRGGPVYTAIGDYPLGAGA